MANKTIRMNLVGPADIRDSKNVNAHESINFYLEESGTGGKTKYYLKSREGASKLFRGETEGNKKIVSSFFPNRDDMPLVCYLQDSNTNSSNYTLNFAGSGYILKPKEIEKSCFNSNGAFVDWCAGLESVVFNASNSLCNFIFASNTAGYFNKIELDNPHYGAASVEYIHGRFCASIAGSTQFYVSDVEDSSNWSPSMYAYAEYSGDSIRKLIAFQDHLWIFGPSSIEVWYDSGNNDFPFERIPGGVIDAGLLSNETITRTDNNLYFIGNSGGTLGVFKTEGYKIIPISIPEVERALRTKSLGYGDRGARWFVSNYDWLGHSFIVVNYTGLEGTNVDYLKGICFVYDETTQLWHKRTTTGMQSYAYNNFGYETKYGDIFDRQVVATGQNTNSIARISPTCSDYYYNTEPTNVVFNKSYTSEHVSGEGSSLFHQYLRLDSDTDNAIIVLYKSDDDANTWTNLGFRDMSKKFTEWWRLGKAEDRIYKIESDSNANITIAGAFVDIEKGTHR